MSQTKKEKSNNSLASLIKVLILLILFGIFAVKVYAGVKLTGDILDKREMLSEQAELTEEDRALIKEWDDIMLDRLVNYGMTLVWFTIVFLCVAKVGPVQKAGRHITKEEAQLIAKELDEGYRKSGVFVDKGEDDDDDSEILPDTLDIPKLKSAKLLDNMIEITWEEVPYADGYTVYRKTEDTKWKKIGRTSMGNTVYQDYALKANTRYIYSVKAFLISEDKRIVSRKDTLGLDVLSGKGNLPDVPEIFAIEEGGKRGIGWKPVKGARAYRVFRSRTGRKWKQIARIPASEGCKYFVQDNLLGDAYKYAVSAAISINKHPVVGEHDKDGIIL